MASSGFEFTTTLTVTDAGSGRFNLSTGQGKLERHDVNTLFSLATLITNFGGIVPQSLDIGVKISAGSGSMSIYNYTIEQI